MPAQNDTKTPAQTPKATTADKVSIRFIKPASETGPDLQPTRSYAPGDVVQVSATSARYWVNKRVAERCDPAKEAAKKKAAAEALKAQAEAEEAAAGNAPELAKEASGNGSKATGAADKPPVQRKS